jgi:hypothetical protein
MIIAIAAASGVFTVFHLAVGLGLGWSITLGVVAFIAFQVLVGMWLRKRVMRDMERVQTILVDGQKKLQAKTQAWQWRPPSSIAAAQKEIFADTKVFVKEALAQTEVLKKYRLWVPMIDRQMATAQLQLNWMIKDFKRVDELMPKALMMDPTMVAMKLARLQMLDAPTADITKCYEKGVRRFKYNQAVLPAACYTWILVKRGETDAAFKALTAALKNSDNEVLKANHVHLMNDRPAHFTNSGLGDQWYSLMLEEPKVKTQRQRSVYR